MIVRSKYESVLNTGICLAVTDIGKREQVEGPVRIAHQDCLQMKTMKTMKSGREDTRRQQVRDRTRRK